MQQFRRVDLSADLVDASVCLQDNKPRGRVSKFARLRFSGARWIYAEVRDGRNTGLPREVNYSTSGRAGRQTGSRPATPDEGIRTIVADENHPGRIEFDNGARNSGESREGRRRRATKNSTTLLAVRARELTPRDSLFLKRYRIATVWNF